MQRLGRNHGGYHGERLALDGILRGCAETARRRTWSVEMILQASGCELIALVSNPNPAQRHPPRPSVYISTGIHGDEPAGPAAVHRLLESDFLPSGCDYWICPCLNPTGFTRNSRTNHEGSDLNRDYKEPRSREVRAHIAWLERQPRFDLAFCLHEDWESHGFYLYELNPDALPSLAERMIDAAKTACPIDPSPEIEGRAATGGIIRPNLDPALRRDWPEAFYLLQNKTRRSYTLEAPSDFPLENRINALVAAVRAALATLDAPR